MDATPSKPRPRVVAVAWIVVAVAVVVAILVFASRRSAAPPAAHDAAAADVAAPPAARDTSAAPATPPGMVLVADEAPFWRGHPEGPPHPFGNPDTHPMRAIRLRPFWIDRTELTNADYSRCVAAGACARPVCEGLAEETRADLPVVCVSWDDAAAYCAWAGKRLPTEAEWEKAARGLDGRKYPWGGDPPTCERAIDVNCSVTAPEPVGAREGDASPYGVLDLAGNVNEWTADWYAPDYYAQAPDDDPPGPPAGTDRVLRGGSFRTGARYLMTGYRQFAPPDSRRPDLGFRCAR